MKFDLENLNPGTWFDFEDGGRICLRSLSTEEATAISKKVTKTKVEYKQGQRFSFEETDDDKAFSLMWDSVIVAWEGIETADGKPLECTTENKLKLMRKSPVFTRTIRGFLEKLTELETTEKEAEGKN
jgi:hypothetical protein